MDVLTYMDFSVFDMVVNCCGHLVFVHLQERHHLIYDGVYIVVLQFVNFYSFLSDLKVISVEVMLEVIPSFICLGGAFTFKYCILICAVC